MTATVEAGQRSQGPWASALIGAAGLPGPEGRAGALPKLMATGGPMSDAEKLTLSPGANHLPEVNDFGTFAPIRLTSVARHLISSRTSRMRSTPTEPHDRNRRAASPTEPTQDWNPTLKLAISPGGMIRESCCQQSYVGSKLKQWVPRNTVSNFLSQDSLRFWGPNQHGKGARWSLGVPASANSLRKTVTEGRSIRYSPPAVGVETPV
jgi:hypothetical protein